jgi:hypothetical protein
LLASVSVLSDARDRALAAKVAQLYGQSQGAFGIGAEHQSTNDWSTARYELGQLEKRIHPHEKIQVLLSVARAIYNSYNYDRNSAHILSRVMAQQQQQQQQRVSSPNEGLGSSASLDSLASSSSTDSVGPRAASPGVTMAAAAAAASALDLVGISSSRSVNNSMAPLNTGSITSAAVAAATAVPGALKQFYLSADEFFPIFLFVLVHTDSLTTPALQLLLISRLADPDALQGEAGYYATVFEAALEYLLNLDVEAFDRRARKESAAAAAAAAAASSAAWNKGAQSSSSNSRLR